MGHTFLFHKVFCTVLFSNNEQNAVTLPHSAQQKHDFLVKMKGKSKSKKQNSKNKVSLELLNQILGHRSTRSLLDEDNVNVWQDIELRLYPDPFCTSFQISTINKKARSDTPLKAKTPLWFLVKTKEKSKLQCQIPKKKVPLELLHQRLVHIPKRSLLDEDNVNVWQEIELRVDPDPFCTSFQISTINK